MLHKHFPIEKSISRIWKSNAKKFRIRFAENVFYIYRIVPELSADSIVNT